MTATKPYTESLWMKAIYSVCFFHPLSTSPKSLPFPCRILSFALLNLPLPFKCDLSSFVHCFMYFAGSPNSLAAAFIFSLSFKNWIICLFSSTLRILYFPLFLLVSELFNCDADPFGGSQNSFSLCSSILLGTSSVSLENSSVKRPNLANLVISASTVRLFARFLKGNRPLPKMYCLETLSTLLSKHCSEYLIF
jgi:hypothetical protein